MLRQFEIQKLKYNCGVAADFITAGLKALGFGTKMWVGILVVFVVGVAVGRIAIILSLRRWPSLRRLIA
jgi:hypothetical protein